MAIARKNTGTTANNGVAATTLNVPYPTPVANGDLLVLHISTNGGNVTSPPGWTVIYNNAGAVVTNPRGGMWIKVADGSETGNLAVTTGSVTSTGAMVSYSGVDPVTPQDATATLVENSVTGTTVITPAITTVTAGTMLVYSNAVNSSTTTSTGPGGGETEVKDYGQELGTAGKSGALYDEPFTGPGSAGTRTTTVSAARANWGAMLALRPAVAASGGAAVAAATGFTTGATAGTTATVTTPSGSSPGDLLVIWVCDKSASNTWSAAGFTAVTAATGTNGSCQVLYRVLDGSGSDPGATFTITASLSGSFAGICMRATGADTVNPFDPAPTSGQVNASSTDITAASITTTVSGDLLIWGGGARVASGAPGTITQPGGYTGSGAGQANASSAGANAGAAACYITWGTAGATGTQGGTQAVASANMAVLLGIRAAPRAGAGGAALPGRTWLRRFHHRQTPPQFQPAAVAVAAPAPVVMRPQITSRLPSRARIGRLGLCAAGIASQIVTPLGAAQPTRPPQPVTPHVATRAVIGPQGTCGAGIASQIVTPLGSMPRPMPRPVIQHLPPNRAVLGPASLPADGIPSAVVTPLGTPGAAWRAPPRRPGPRRAVWHGNAAPAAVAAPAAQAFQRPPPQPRRPAPSRAIWRGNAVTVPRGTPGPAWRPQPRRPGPGRAVWHGNAGPANAAPVTQATPRPPPQPRRPPPRRAVWHGNASSVVTPPGTAARRPGPQITSRPRSRVVWRGNAGPQPVTPVAATPPPRSKPLPPRRSPRRAVIRRGSGLTNLVPAAVQNATSSPTVAAGSTFTAAVSGAVSGASVAAQGTSGPTVISPVPGGVYTGTYTGTYQPAPLTPPQVSEQASVDPAVSDG